uniref:CCDC22 coiled-coil domain-containing protein n=1 Tax=Eutreptiella gymnastica TaxID=73025 RepID=A0A7S4FSK6_9EUGL
MDEMRKVLSWLVGALPSTEEPVADHTGIAGQTLHSKALSAIDELFGRSVTGKRKTINRMSKEDTSSYQWTPVRDLRTAHIIPFVAPASHEEALYVADKVDLVSSQPLDSRDFPMSVVEYNQAQIAKDRQTAADWEDRGIHTGMSRKDYRTKKAQKLLTKIQSALAESVSRYNAVNVSKLFAPPRVPDEEPERVRETRFMKELKFAKHEANEAPAELEEPGMSEEELAELRRQEKEAEEASLREELQRLEAKLAKLDAKLAAVKAETEKTHTEAQATSEKAKDLSEEGKDLEAQYGTQQRTIEYADDLVGNKKKLLAAEQATLQEIADVKSQFSEKEAKYKAQHDALIGDQENAKRMIQNKLDEIKRIKKRRKHLANEIHEKEERKAALEAEYDKLPKNIERELFISRIMDIIKNIKKQQNEITKINMDSKDLQKEINNANDAVTRSFIATEEKVYKDAAKDNVAKQVYRQLIALRENFDQLIRAVEETGQLKQQQYELEEKKNALEQRNDGINMERLQEDLGQIRTENQQLQADVKALKKK